MSSEKFFNSTYTHRTVTIVAPLDFSFPNTGPSPCAAATTAASVVTVYKTAASSPSPSPSPSPVPNTQSNARIVAPAVAVPVTVVTLVILAITITIRRRKRRKTKSAAAVEPPLKPELHADDFGPELDATTAPSAKGAAILPFSDHQGPPDIAELPAREIPASEMDAGPQQIHST
ncbi:hypothetical protein T310_3261 [Rasamsonia emersonii CBS 393.64]|uniref:Uncharacterized protein n=1 Tax=Rasamsonia emersonii (strain ATCC 16479 / CBS 393.64 / IMI 116815) TaxID=1408163 RepID=A0A0F4YYM3_RASE3|nr:hypothetical protein T310_3261 [Rasamsonia emersonii CBS 393.64]KKA22718.1 hypothetical protein T310_3261 [Rasamsonia emersonii CBS 393.64]